MRRAAAAVVVFCAAAAPAQAHPKLGRYHNVRSTGYCYPQRTSMGTRARWGVVAVPQESWMFTRRIYVVHGIKNRTTGRLRHWFRAEDHIGSGSNFDVYVPWEHEPDCSWGRRLIAYRVEL